MDELKFEVGDIVNFNSDEHEKDSYHYCKVVEMIDSKAFVAQVIDTNFVDYISNGDQIYAGIDSFHKITDKKLVNKLNKMMVFQ